MECSFDPIANANSQLQSTTQTYQSGVQKIIKQFKTGPVENRSNDQAAKKPYLEQLNAKYNTKVDETKKQLESGRVKSSDWVSDAHAPCFKLKGFN